MTSKIICGDSLTELKKLPDGSIHAACTSPPYLGLRSYLPDGHNDKPMEIGLEESPEQYIERLVEVFREVKRVLHPSGTLWLNMGSSYASSTFRGNQSPPLEHVPACDTDGKESPDSQASGRACLDSCDAHPGENQTHHGRTVRNDQCGEPTQPPVSKITHDTGPSGQAGADASPDDDQVSTILSSSGASSESASSPSALDDPSVSQTSVPDAQLSVHTGQNKPDRSAMSQPLTVRTEGKESFFSACDSPDCKGVGRCGLCWCNLTIPLLNIKPKDLVMMPSLLAMALQADGWWLRADCIWAKGISFCDSYAGSVMPQSVQDRPSTSHEYVFLLSKSAHYFYDIEAVKEKAVEPERQRNERIGGANGHTVRHSPGGMMQASATRNLRSVWCINPAPLRESHFATFPPALVKPCILAGTSAGGCCPACLAPYERIVERKFQPQTDVSAVRGIRGANGQKGLDDSNTWAGYPRGTTAATTTGWRPTCACDAGDPVPATVLDPFCGAGTTLLVAERLGRDSIGIELNAEYCEMARRRIYDDAPLFAAVAGVDTPTKRTTP